MAGKGKAIAGMILGIVGIVCSFLFFNPYIVLAGLPIAIVGLVLSVVGRKQLAEGNNPTGIGTAGLVLGIIATVFTAIMFCCCGLCAICAIASTAV